MDRSAHPLPRLLESLSRGDGRVLLELIPLVQQALLEAAEGRLPVDPKGARRLVTVAWRRFGGGQEAQRNHFRALAASQVRRLQVERARAALDGSAPRPGRDGDRPAPDAARRAEHHAHLLAIHDALAELAARDERRARLIELVAFGGLDRGAAAEVLSVPRATVERDWARAEAWLGSHLGPAPEDGSRSEDAGGG